MTKQDNAFKEAVAQMVNLGKEYLIAKLSTYSDLNQCKDVNDRRKLSESYYNEIAATANVIRLLTGREIRFRWLSAGFELYEIMPDAPCVASCSAWNTVFDRYSGKREKVRHINWQKGLEQGEIIKIYEIMYDADANPCYVGGYQTAEFQTE
jgi:hypothetical protein